MAQFLTTTDTSAAIERVIREAEKQLILISAYVYPRLVYLDRLRDAADRGVHITLMFGKRQMDDKVRDQFEKVRNLEIYFLDELHAKCYFNEKEAVVTSLNMLNSSEAKNREMGVLLTRAADPQAYNDCVREARSIRAAAQAITRRPEAPRRPAPVKHVPAPRVYPSPLQTMVTGLLRGLMNTDSAFCIRCATHIAPDGDKPLCGSCYREWAQWKNKDYKEVYCHRCGKESTTSIAKPFCRACYARA